MIIGEPQTKFVATFPKQQILDFSILKEFADSNSEFDENGG